MTTTWIVVTLLALGGHASAADVNVYLTAESATTTYPAKRIASAIFKKAGLTIVWGTGKTLGASPGISMRVILAEGTPSGRLPGALAVAYPYADCSKSIVVFYDRIRTLAGRPDRESPLLAYVLVHEITHVLQGVDRHEPTGVMKALWNQEDREAIFANRLPFPEEDALRMRQGPAAACRPRTGILTGLSESRIAVHPE